MFGETAAPPPSATGSGSASAIAVVPPDAVPAPPPLASCIAEPLTATDSVVLTPTTIDFCSGDAAPRTCWRVDATTKRIEPRTVVKIEDTETSRNATRNADGSVAICPPPGACVTVKPPFAIGDEDMLGANADGTVLVRYVDQAPLEIYDVATWKLRGKIAPWKTEMGDPPAFISWTFAGPNLIAWTTASPVSSEGRSFTLAGKLVGRVGPKSFTQNELESWPTQSTTWLFKQFDGTKLIAVEVATAKLVKMYDLAPLAEHTSDELQVALRAARSTAGGRCEGQYITAAGIASTAETIVYLSTSGVLGVITRATGVVDVIAPPSC